MAYKFQLGPAILSGSTTMKEALTVEDSFNANSLSSSGNLSVGGDVRIDGATAVNVANTDQLYFRDADGTVKMDEAQDVRDLFFSAVSGDATIAAGGALTIGAGAVEHGMLAEDIISGQAELAHADINDADDMLIDDAGTVKKVGVDSLRDHFFGVVSGDATIADGGALTIGADKVLGTMLNTSVADTSTIELSSDTLSVLKVPNALSQGTNSGLAPFSYDGSSAVTVALSSSVAGDGLALSSGVLSVGVDDAGIEIDSDALRLKNNGVTLAKMAGITRGSIISGDASNDPQYLALGSDAQMLISDGSDLGYVSVSGDITITNAGVTAIGATKVTDAMLNDDVAAGLAGVGLGASGGVLAVQVSGAIVLDNDKLGLSGSIAGDGLKFIGGAESLSTLEVDLEGLPGGDVSAANDSIAFIDADGGLSKKESIADLMTAVAGDGIVAGSGALSIDVADMATSMTGDVADADKFAISDGGTMKKVDFSVVRDAVFADVSGDATVAAGGALTIAAGAVEEGMLNDNVISGQAELAAADIADADEMLISDAGTLKKVGIDSLATFFRGMSVNAIGDANGDLAEGLNYGTAAITLNRDWVLPDAPAVGDQVIVKAPVIGDSVSITVKVDAGTSHKIDGNTLTSVSLEEDGAAVTLVYAAANLWLLV